MAALFCGGVKKSIRASLKKSMQQSFCGFEVVLTRTPDLVGLRGIGMKYYTFLEVSGALGKANLEPSESTAKRTAFLGPGNQHLLFKYSPRSLLAARSYKSGLVRTLWLNDLVLLG